MLVEPVIPEEASADFEDAVYRVRLWNRPSNPLDAWALDEYDLIHASDVSEVIDWASRQPASSYEVGVRWPYVSQGVDGRRIERFRFFRIAGEAGFQGGSTRTETFTLS